VNSSDPQFRDDLNWADCCDALHAEYWLRRMNEVKLARRAAQRIFAADAGRQVEDAQTRGDVSRASK
jgi:hypothetical protein